MRCERSDAPLRRCVAVGGDGAHHCSVRASSSCKEDGLGRVWSAEAHRDAADDDDRPDQRRDCCVRAHVLLIGRVPTGPSFESAGA